MGEKNKNWWEIEGNDECKPVYVGLKHWEPKTAEITQQQKNDASQTLWWSLALVTLLICFLGYYSFGNLGTTGSTSNPATHFVFNYANGSAALYRKAAALIESGDIRDNKDLVDFVSSQAPIIRETSASEMKPFYESLNGEGWDSKKAIAICNEFAKGFDAVKKGK